MRLTRAALRGRVNGVLQFRFSPRRLTSHAGLELVRGYLRATGFTERVRRSLARHLPRSDYPVSALVLLILGLLIAGGRRVWHLRYVEDDPLVQRFAGLRRIPTPKTVGAWLRSFTPSSVRALQQLNAEVTAEALERLGVRRLTVDVDGSVVSTGLQVEGARRGFNPHHRKVPSYYPITAYEAQSGQLLRVQNRSGNVHDGKASLPFLRDLLQQLDSTLERPRLTEFRMDGAFFRSDVIELLDEHGAEWAIKVPFYPWLSLKSYVAEAPEWRRVAAGISYCESRVHVKTWQRTLRIVLYRKRVRHETRKNFQLDLYDPADGHYEYSAIATNKDLSGPMLWRFLNGRGAHEKAFAELKGGFAFATVPTQAYIANSAWQLLSVLAFNLTRGFQAASFGTRRTATRTRRCLFRFESIHTLRFKLIGKAAAMIRPAGRTTLEIADNPATVDAFNQALQALEAA